MRSENGLCRYLNFFRENNELTESDEEEEGSILPYSVVIQKAKAKLFDISTSYISCAALLCMAVSLLNETHIL